MDDHSVGDGRLSNADRLKLSRAAARNLIEGTIEKNKGK